MLRDFNAKLDPVVASLFDLSKFVRAHVELIEVAIVILIVCLWLVFRRADGARKDPWFFRRGCRCSNRWRSCIAPPYFAGTLGILLGSGVPLTMTLRILVDMIGSGDHPGVWSKAVDRVRHGGKLSDALADTTLLPAMAIRMLRIGEETGQLPVLAGNVAEFYEAKLQRSLDRVVGITGPLAIVIISIDRRRAYRFCDDRAAVGNTDH